MAAPAAGGPTSPSALPLRALHSTSLFGSCRVSDSPFSRFLETCELSGVVGPHVETLWGCIQQHHTAGGRFYHTLDHCMAMFDFLRFAARAGLPCADPAAVEWAVWFHDVVYDPASSTNEAESAELAGQLLGAAGLPQHTVQKVQRFIMATADHHHLEGENDADLLLDADMAILGAPLQRYTDYAVAVRREYGHLSDEQYTKDRARVLKGLLDREQLFLTDVGKSACEAAARANMSHEWRLVFGGQLLQTNALEEGNEDVQEADEATTQPSLPSRSASLASAGTGSTAEPAGAGSAGGSSSAAAAAAAAARALQ